MRKPELPHVDEKEVRRFRKRYPKLHPTVQDIFAELNVLYEQEPVCYNKRSPHTKFNLRHRTHPQTNLSEANGLNFLVCAGYPVRYIEDKGQYDGVDLEYYKNGEWISTSVKLCAMAASCLTIHYTIRDALMTDPSKEVFFVDNRQPSGLLIATKDLRLLLPLMPVSPYKFTRYLLWFDKVRDKEVTFYGVKNDKN